MLLPMVTCFQSERSSIADITLSYPHTYNILFTVGVFNMAPFNSILSVSPLFIPDNFVLSAPRFCTAQLFTPMF